MYLPDVQLVTSSGLMCQVSLTSTLINIFHALIDLNFNTQSRKSLSKIG